MSGVLTVANGTAVASIRLKGDCTASTFTLASDGGGGVIVTDPATKGRVSLVRPDPLVHAIASFQVSPPSGMAGAPAWRVPKQPMICAHGWFAVQWISITPSTARHSVGRIRRRWATRTECSGPSSSRRQ